MATKTLKDEAERDKKAWELVRDASKKRMQDYADRLEASRLKQTSIGSGLGAVAGGVLGGPVGAIVGGALGGYAARKLGTLQGAKSSARKVRALAEGKEKKDKKKLFEDLKKEFDIKEEGEEKEGEEKEESGKSEGETKTK